VIQVQIRLQGLDYGGKEDTKTVDDGVLVYPNQKFFRVSLLWCSDSDEYRGVEIDAYLGRWSPNEKRRVDCKARMAQTDPDPCDVGV
jgi:hypothetical protein